MKMPQLLSGHTMTPAGILRPQSMQLSLRADGTSTASMVLDSESPDVQIGTWIQIWAPNGEMCVMYVKNRKKDYITGNITLTLEHTFSLLSDMVVFGEITAETMSGTTGATTCTVKQAIQYLLGQQTETLFSMNNADCDFNDAQGWKFTNSDIHSDLNSLTDAIQDCQWEFDQTSLPWKLKLKEWPTSATMELRRNRNLESLQVTLDRSGMYTRAYPTGKNNLHIDSVNSNVSYLDRNTATYGVIANVITDSTIASPDLLKAWAEKQLKKNSVPKVSVTISGYELSQATGESLDKLVIGRMCRIPLPEYGETVTERLSELSWKDAISQPEAVTCTLANELKTLTGVLNEKARGGGGGSKRANTEHDCELGEDEEKIEEFDNSDIWINRDSVWAVCGAYEVTTLPGGGKKLKMVEGTALVLERNHTEYGIYDEGNLTGGICVDKINGQSGTVLKLTADVIDIQGVISKLVSENIQVMNITVTGDGVFTDGVTCATVDANDGTSGFKDIYTKGLEIDDTSFVFDNDTVTWQSYTARYIETSSLWYFLRAATDSTTPTGTTLGRVITGSRNTTIHYLGKAST